jgi:branched-chain amino acid transport system ATP-binding protein
VASTPGTVNVTGPTTTKTGPGVIHAVAPDAATLVFVEHDMEIVSRYTHRVLAFSEGRIIADGDPGMVLKDAEVRRYVIGEDIHLQAGHHAQA